MRTGWTSWRRSGRRPRTVLVRLQDAVPVERAESRITAAARVPMADVDSAGLAAVQLEGRSPAATSPPSAALAARRCGEAGAGHRERCALVVLTAPCGPPRDGRRIALAPGAVTCSRSCWRRSDCCAQWGSAWEQRSPRSPLARARPAIQTQLGRPAPGNRGDRAAPGTARRYRRGSVRVALALAFVPLVTPAQRRLGDLLRAGARSTSDTLDSSHMRASHFIALEVRGVARAAGWWAPSSGAPCAWCGRISLATNRLVRPP